jgi:hypothetical protein
MMKKTLCLAGLGLLLTSLASLAESAGTPAQPYTWDYLATVGGATAATLLIVQYLKVPLDRWRHIPTRFLVLAIAFLILTTARAFTTGLTLRDLPLLVVNAFLVSLSAMGAYEISFARVDAWRDPPSQPAQAARR